jgi:hypothetical protein
MSCKHLWRRWGIQLKKTRNVYETALYADRSQLLPCCCFSICFLAVFVFVSLSGHSWAPFSNLVVMGLQIIRSVQSLQCPPFYSAGTICMKIETGSYFFPMNKAQLLHGLQFGEPITYEGFGKKSQVNV